MSPLMAPAPQGAVGLAQHGTGMPLLHPATGAAACKVVAVQVAIRS